MLSSLQQQLGPLALPLLICALTTGAILLERLVILTTHTFSSQLKRDGQRLLELHQNEARGIQEDIAGLWLHNRQRRLSSGIRLLQIMALVSPLLGLLGTVVGLIQVFDNIALHQGPIEPALLADGLGIAMKTTAAGLIIALPALLGAHLFQLWVDKLSHSTEQAMNIYSLKNQGICTEAIL